MSRGAVVFDRVWKKFHRGERHDSLRDLLPSVVRSIMRRSGPDTLSKQEFWALRDVSFDVRPGQALGIIGANGAGKSTVLKLLTRILRPTRGVCELRGRVGALIEIAAGFHQDLTGRENVYLQGAIMGMKRVEITRKFDEIVAFAALDEFIDTPVKRYSSGMNARLGFAIAAHLDPDVLIIDEVLAVGDLNFQTKAFDRISAIVKQDIPVVIVSHQLDRVAALCSEVMVLSHGEVVQLGSPEDSISAYIQQQTPKSGYRPSDVAVRLERLTVVSETPVRSGDRVHLQLSASMAEDAIHDDSLSVAIHVRSAATGQVIFRTGSKQYDTVLPSKSWFTLDLDLQMNVPPGRYTVETHLFDVPRQLMVSDGPVALLQVAEGPAFKGAVQLNARMRVRTADPIALVIGR